MSEKRKELEAAVKVAKLKVHLVEQEGLAALREMADFDTLCKLSEKLHVVDRECRIIHRRIARLIGKKRGAP